MKGHTPGVGCVSIKLVSSGEEVVVKLGWLMESERVNIRRERERDGVTQQERRRNGGEEMVEMRLVNERTGRRMWFWT